MTSPAFLCEHAPSRAIRRSFRETCGVCGSYWDLESRAIEPVYDERYPAERGHFDPRVGALKQRTLVRWLRQGGIDLESKVVCEVGFGGGACLPLLGERARRVYGIEANASAIDRVRATGCRAALVWTERLPARLDELVDLWLFQDSFEHIPDPASFATWMIDNSAPAAEILIVLPRGDSVSQRVLGRLWPHKLPDHHFQWSRAGLIEFFARRGFAVRQEFFPLKLASPQMVVAHLLHKAGAPSAVRSRVAGARFALPINFGEMGLVFRRSG